MSPSTDNGRFASNWQFDMVHALPSLGELTSLLLQRFGPYVTEREQSTWFKIRNTGYSQMIGREELFERERHSEPVAGWHSCTLVCETAD
jgi:hypothetical protein